MKWMGDYFFLFWNWLLYIFEMHGESFFFFLYTMHENENDNEIKLQLDDRQDIMMNEATRYFLLFGQSILVALLLDIVIYIQVLIVEDN